MGEQDVADQQGAFCVSRGRGGLAILRRVLALLASQFEPSVRSALFVSARRLTMQFAPTLGESLDDSLGGTLTSFTSRRQGLGCRGWLVVAAN